MMAKFHIEYYSNALHRRTTFDMLIPNDIRQDIPWEKKDDADRGIKTLFWLHGYTGRSENWVPEELCEKFQIAVVMPTAENSFYLDGEATGRAYETMVAVELVDYVRKTFSLASSPEDTYIAGLSMGGFGALHTGLAHPDRFGKIGCMSSALIVHEIAHAKPGFDNGIGNYAYYRSCFGDLETVEERDVNPEILALRLKETASAFPELFMCCGTEDFLIEPNRYFHRFLVENKIPHQYFESPGGHDGVFWSEYIVKIINWMFA